MLIVIIVIAISIMVVIACTTFTHIICIRGLSIEVRVFDTFASYCMTGNPAGMLPLFKGMRVRLTEK